jgi:hypothetical protein
MIDGFGRMLCQECTGVMEHSPIEAKSREGNRLVIFRCRAPECGHVTIVELRPAERRRPEPERVWDRVYFQL